MEDETLGSAPSAVELAWWHAGEEHVRKSVDALPINAMRAPSLLPGWSRAHVVGHLTGNARGLLNLLSWASTGRERAMYASDDARRTEIEAEAARPAAQVLDGFRSEQRRLREAVLSTPAGVWSRRVRSGLGREIGAGQIVWLRSREVWIHSVDLGLEATFASLPNRMTDRLLSEVSRTLSDRMSTTVILLADDRDETWRLGPETLAAPIVTGSANQLLAWILGRSSGSDLRRQQCLPSVPRWI